MNNEVKNRETFNPKSAFPHKGAFFPMEGLYLNAGVQHPMSRGAAKAIDDYIRYKSFQTKTGYDPLQLRKNVLEKYSKLINSDIDEITYVTSTTVGENLVIQALELEKNGGRIVTDDLHYFGSYQIYGELQKKGVEVITIRNKNGVVDLADYEAAITNGTCLVAVSGVSTFNGFQHDLKKISALAHKKGALVYADIIHQVGSVPFDVKETNVDFCACGSFKWLMADQGLGFLYVKKNVLPKLKRPWFGKRQVSKLTTHVFPGDTITKDNQVYEYELTNTTEGYFSVWSEPRIIIGQLDYSLEYLLTVGVDKIMKYRQPMLDLLQDEIPKIGFNPLTPKGSVSALLAYECEDARNRLTPIMDEAGISMSIYKGHFRIALSVYNDMDDMNYLLKTLRLVK